MGTSVVGDAGKSMVMPPSAKLSTVRIPLRLLNRTVAGVPRSTCKACAVANVAWPHMFASRTGVNHRIP